MCGKGLQYGLLGRGISYSRSPEIHDSLWKEKGKACEYLLYDTDDLTAFFEWAKGNRRLDGFNVTIPYKEQVIPFLDTLDDDAAKVGAVNTVKCLRSDSECRFIGYNTDVAGFEQTLGLFTIRPDAHAIVLGTGGASKAVCHAFSKQNIPYRSVSRTAGKGYFTYEDLDTLVKLPGQKVIVNATPMGTVHLQDVYPPLPYTALTEIDILIDLVYTPEETPFMAKGKAAGAQVSGGFTMLYGQARAAQAIWERE